MQPITLEITGTVVSLKNSRRLVRKARTGKPFSIKSADAERWMRDAVAQIPAKYRGLKLGNQEHPLCVSIVVYYPSFRQDLSLDLVYDSLQVGGVIENDRWIRRKIDEAKSDKSNPRLEITITEES